MEFFIMNKELCKATNQDGSPCQAYSLSDSIYCWAHEPSLENLRTEAKSIGGRKSKYIEGMPVKITGIETILDLIGEVIGNLKEMDISISQARAMLTACDSAMKALEYKELSDRVAALENRLGES